MAKHAIAKDVENASTTLAMTATTYGKPAYAKTAEITARTNHMTAQ